jgi:hypothetical protein
MKSENFIISAIADSAKADTVYGREVDGCDLLAR